MPVDTRTRPQRVTIIHAYLHKKGLMALALSQRVPDGNSFIPWSEEDRHLSTPENGCRAPLASLLTRVRGERHATPCCSLLVHLG